MKHVQYALTAILLGICAAAQADGGGTFYHAGIATTLTSAYAYATPEWWDKSKQAVVVVFRDQPIDAAMFDAAPDREKAFHDLVGNFKNKGNSVQVTIGPDKEGRVRVVEVNTSYNSADGEFKRTSGSVASDFYTLDLKSNDGKRIEGSIRSTHESEKTEKNGAFYDLHFALNVASGTPFGPGLPPDGGEPFKAYAAYADALKEATSHLDQATYEALLVTLSYTRIEAMKQIAKNAGKAGADVKILAELKKMKDRVPDFYKFVSGRVKGDVATMEIKSGGQSYHYVDGSQIADPELIATVTMKKEDGNWSFDKDQGHAVGSGKAPPAAAKSNK